MAKIAKKPKKFIDSDQDGLSDWDETHIYGSDPHDEDTDGDGIDDGEAVLKGMSPAGAGYFKDLFIPSHKNGYKPQALKGKRIIFHVAAALAIKLVVVAFVLVYPLSAWLMPDVAAEQSRQIISLTNQFRTSLDLPTLKENTKLNQAAYAKVSDMFLNQYFAHTSPENKNLDSFLKQTGYIYSVSGENLGMGFSDSQELMTAWKNSPTHYANLVDEDFQEIGVSMAEDIFKDGNTVFTAQYFGRPQTPVIMISKAKPVVVNKPSVTVNSASKVVLAAHETGPIVNPVVKIAPDVKIETKVIPVPVAKVEPKVAVKIDRPVGKDENIVKVEAVLPAETTSASASILNNIIPLAQAETGDWQGQAIVTDKQAGVIVPASITAIDNQGNANVNDVATENITPQKTSLTDQYFLLRNNPNKTMQKIFDISSFYFKFILFLVIISLLLSIFIKIKKQHPKLIFSSLGLIAFLIILITI